MKLPKPSEGDSGISFIEILLVVGILTIIFSIGLPVAVNFYLDYQLDSETALFVSLLRHARNLALINNNESDHGIFIAANDFVLFQGSSYAARDQAQDQDFGRNSAISISGPSEAVFSALSGQVASSTFTISDNRSRTKTVGVNPGGLVYEL